jgi:hypothetical protein
MSEYVIFDQITMVITETTSITNIIFSKSWTEHEQFDESSYFLSC